MTEQTQTTINDDNEELFLKDKLQSAKHALAMHVKEDIARKNTKASLEKIVEETEQAVIDYLQGNGLLETEHFKLLESYKVDAPSIEAVPEKYIRTKTIKEVNKALIRAERPAGNWYSMKESFSVAVKADGK